jgi:FkbM family methyltransferase
VLLNAFANTIRAGKRIGLHRGWFQIARAVRRISPEARLFPKFVPGVGDVYLDLGETMCFALFYSEPAQPETAIFETFIRPNYVVYDIGANFGWTTAVAAKSARHVYAFEPGSSSLRLLNATAATRKNVTVYPIALGEIDDQVDCYVSSRGDMTTIGSMNEFAPNVRSVERVPMHRLDSLVESEHLLLPDFLSCDVEGYELKMFAGAGETLKRAQPFVFFEFALSYGKAHGYELSDLLQSLQSRLAHGTRFYRVRQNGELQACSAVTDDSSNNYLAIPPSRTR